MSKPLSPRRFAGAPAAVMAVSLGLGVMGAAVTYRAVSGAAASSSEPAPVAAVPTPSAASAQSHRRTARWAPCAPPAVLEAGACVTEVVHEIVVAPPASSGISQVRVTATRRGAAAHGEHGGEHGDGPADD